MIKILKYDKYPYKSKKCRVMKIPKHVLRCPEVYQQYDILSFCEHLILRLSSILSRFQHSVVYRAKRAQFRVKSILVKMRFQNLCFGTKIKIFNFFSFLTRNESQMVKNHLVKIQWTIWTHFWPNLSIFRNFQFFKIWSK